MGEVYLLIAAIALISAAIGYLARGEANELLLEREYQRGVGDGAWIVSQSHVELGPSRVIKGGKHAA